ncbi:hypothetical protein [Rhodoplanes azumiensis]|uniref:Lipoprotein n=1 Tax=Rhodoplanes azumiensis TaxID=1897628 RepID=A0ABW5AE01_9BRAD
MRHAAFVQDAIRSMRRARRARSVAAVLAASVAAAAAGCSSMPEVADVKLLPSASSLMPTPTGEFAKSAVNTNRPVSPGDLVDAQGMCAGAVSSSGEPGATAMRGVGLDMTECEVVQVIGPPGSTQIGANQRGERTVVMTYATTERSGIYHFTNGRLTMIERGPEPPAPEKPARGKPARRTAS